MRRNASVRSWVSRALVLLLIARQTSRAQGADDLLAVLPSARTTNPNAIALIIGNSTYTGDLPAVRFAVRDAEVMERYARDVLGVPPRNIYLVRNATLGQLRAAFRTRLANAVRTIPDPAAAEIFVYYSGHGAPTVPAGAAFLVPTDGDPDVLEETAYPLDEVYAQLAQLGARRVTVVLDACFSGQSDGGSLFRGVRPVIRVVQGVPTQTGLTVFAASTGTQVSSDFDAKGHGLFTYFFLRGLQGAADQERDGRITVGELGTYLREQVPGYARRLRNREQDPTVAGAPDAVIATVTPLPRSRSLPSVDAPTPIGRAGTPTAGTAPAGTAPAAPMAPRRGSVQLSAGKPSAELMGRIRENPARWVRLAFDQLGRAQIDSALPIIRGLWDAKMRDESMEIVGTSLATALISGMRDSSITDLPAAVSVAMFADTISPRPMTKYVVGYFALLAATRDDANRPSSTVSSCTEGRRRAAYAAAARRHLADTELQRSGVPEASLSRDVAAAALQRSQEMETFLRTERERLCP